MIANLGLHVQRLSNNFADRSFEVKLSVKWTLLLLSSGPHLLCHFLGICSQSSTLPLARPRPVVSALDRRSRPASRSDHIITLFLICTACGFHIRARYRLRVLTSAQFRLVARIFAWLTLRGAAVFARR